MPQRTSTVQSVELGSPSVTQEQAQRPAESTQEIEATVLALVPAYGQVKVRSRDGHVYALTAHTQGIRLGELREGQRIRCEVTLRLPRVLRASVLA
ncbi:hypothetical protein BH11PSE8_BH11PSE8_12700 [soil metagenome]